MIEPIQNEFDDFYKFHKNKYNILFHIICGFVYMTFLFLTSSNSYLFLIIYSVIILLTVQNLFIGFIIFIITLILLHTTKRFNLTQTNLIILFLIFYFLPDLSHYLTNEPTLLNLNNITFFSIFTNIFYLLPFSLLSLFNVEQFIS
jgi:hypothetical protein